MFQWTFHCQICSKLLSRVCGLHTKLNSFSSTGVSILQLAALGLISGEPLVPTGPLV